MHIECRYNKSIACREHAAKGAFAACLSKQSTMKVLPNASQKSISKAKDWNHSVPGVQISAPNLCASILRMLLTIVVQQVFDKFYVSQQHTTAAITLEPKFIKGIPTSDAKHFNHKQKIRVGIQPRNFKHESLLELGIQIVVLTRRYCKCKHTLTTRNE